MKKVHSQKLVGFDMDGVVLDFSRLKILVAAEHGVVLEPHQTQSGIFEYAAPPAIIQKIKVVIYDDPIVSLQPKLMPGVLEILKKLSKNKTQFVLISRRRNSEVAERLLGIHGLWPKYFNKQNAFFVPDIAGKDVKAKELGVTHYIDDDVEVLQSLKSVPNKFLFDPHGALLSAKWYERVASFVEFAKELQSERLLL